MDKLPSFGRYEALFRIAAGGMAEVFAARIRGEAGFEKLVAVKRMLPHLAEDEAFVEMFLDEARVAVHVSSPYVVPTLDLGRADDGALYIVMELVVGQALSTLIRDQRRKNARVPIPIALELLAQAAQGLDDAHEAVTPTGIHLGLVHRDVSPLVQVVSGDVPFDQAWAGGDPVPAVKLGAAPTPLKISVEGDSDTETRPIEVKVRFCKDASCTALGDDVAPEVRMHLERAFYIGERTSYTWSIACMPNVPGQTDPPPVCDTKQRAQNDVPKCKVAGCRSGVTSEYCSGGKHFCE